MNRRSRDPDLRILAVRFRELVAIATAAGTRAAWLDETSEMQIAALVELAEHRIGSRDPRRRASLELGRRIARAKCQGATMDSLVERFGRKRSQIFALLALVREHPRTDLRSTMREPIEPEHADP